MLREIKQLKLKIAETTLHQLEVQEDKIWADFDRLKREEADARNRLRDLTREQKYQVGAFRAQKYSFFKRLRARQAYHDYRNALTEMQNLNQRLQVLPDEIQMALQQVSHDLAGNDLKGTIRTVRENLEQLMNAQDLSDLGLSLSEAMQFLEKQGKPAVVDQSDCYLVEHPAEYQEMGDLVMVVKTGALTQNENGQTHVPSPCEVDVPQTASINLHGTNYPYTFPQGGNSVRGTLNGMEPFDPAVDNPQQQRYVVLQPVAGIPQNRIGSLLPGDSYVRGTMFGKTGLDLTRDAWVLCPKAEVKTMQALHHDVHVLGYTGNAKTGLPEPKLVAAVISQLGYRAETIRGLGWDDEKTNYQSSRQLKKLAVQANIPLQQYANSVDGLQDAEMNNINQSIALSQMLVNRQLVQSSADYRILKPQIDEQYQSFIQLSHRRSNLNYLLGSMQRAGWKITQEQYDDLAYQVEDITSLNAREVRENLNVNDYVRKVMVDCALQSQNKEQGYTR